MRATTLLTVTSLLSVLLGSFHISDDIVLGIESGGTSNYTGILIFATYAYASLMLDRRRWAHAIVLLMSIGGAAVPYVHMTGVGLVGGKAASGTGKLFWVWTLMALGVTALVSVVLAAQGLWALRRGRTAAVEAR